MQRLYCYLKNNKYLVNNRVNKMGSAQGIADKKDAVQWQGTLVERQGSEPPN